MDHHLLPWYLEHGNNPLPNLISFHFQCRRIGGLPFRIRIGVLRWSRSLLSRTDISLISVSEGYSESKLTYVMRWFMDHQTPWLVLVSVPSPEVICSMNCILLISLIPQRERASLRVTTRNEQTSHSRFYQMQSLLQLSNDRGCTYSWTGLLVSFLQGVPWLRQLTLNRSLGLINSFQDLFTFLNIPLYQLFSALRGKFQLTYVVMGFSVKTLIPAYRAGMIYSSCVASTVVTTRTSSFCSLSILAKSSYSSARLSLWKSWRRRWLTAW